MQDNRLSTADMVDAYKTYQNQWTSTNKKTLVKDASKALQQYNAVLHAASPTAPTPTSAADPKSPKVNYDLRAPDFYTDEYGRPERVPYGTDGHPIPDDLSLMLLGPEGPELPLLSTMMTGFQAINFFVKMHIASL